MEGPIRTVSRDAFAALVGTELGVSSWMAIEQPAIETFADLTRDRYFIHVDPARAAQTRFGGTIAHGFLTLSMLSWMAYEVCPAIAESKTSVNYGFDRLRFVAPVPSGSRIRGRFFLKAFDVKVGRWQARYDATVEIEGADRPALAAEWLVAGFF